MHFVDQFTGANQIFRAFFFISFCFHANRLQIAHFGMVITVTTITQNVPHAHEQYETTARNKTAILLYDFFFLNPLRFMS